MKATKQSEEVEEIEEIKEIKETDNLIEEIVGTRLILKRIGILLATAASFALIWVLFVIMENQYAMMALKDSSNTVLEAQLQAEGLHNLYVTHISRGSSKRVSEEVVQWWHNEGDDKYYLFLPSSADLNGLKLGLEGVDAIQLDGKSISNGKKFQTTLGEHTVSTDVDDKTYQLVFMKSENLPSIFIETKSGTMDYVNETKGNQEEGTTLIMDPYGDAIYLGPLEYIRGRGNVTWDNANKKGYHIKLPKKEDLFGMGAAKDWILLANDFDGSMLRNMTTFHIAQQSEVAYTPDSLFIDLYINATYWGTYQLCEKVEVSPSRVDIPDLETDTEMANPGVNLAECPRFGEEYVQETATVPGTRLGYMIPNEPADITGGYLLELDIGGRYVHELAGFVTTRNRAIEIHSPKYPSFQETNYIADLYQEFEDAVYEFDGINKETGKSYTEYIDVDSFAKKYLMEEITKNLDAMVTSQYLYKYPDKVSNKLYAGPVWDYDSAIGNGMASGSLVNDQGEIDYGADTTSPVGLYAMKDRAEAPIWFALYYRPEFQEAFKRYYKESFRQNVLDEMDHEIDHNAEQILDSSIMNRIRWSNAPYAERDRLETDYFLSVEDIKSFLRERIQYLDTEWG